MKITATKEFTFDSAHYLPGYDGACSNTHGHTYKLQVTVQRELGGSTIQQGSSAGMVADFKVLKEFIQREVIARFDHQLINKVVTYRPTAENMAVDIFNCVNAELQESLKCVSIKLWETPTSYVEVTE